MEEKGRPGKKKGERGSMNKKEVELKGILERAGLGSFILIAEGVGTALRLPPKDRYTPGRVLNLPPKYLILAKSGEDELISGLDPGSLKKVWSLLSYLLKRVKDRVKENAYGPKET